jgi:hypothetical protein
MKEKREPSDVVGRVNRGGWLTVVGSTFLQSRNGNVQDCARTSNNPKPARVAGSNLDNKVKACYPIVTNKQEVDSEGSTVHSHHRRAGLRGKLCEGEGTARTGNQAKRRLFWNPRKGREWLKSHFLSSDRGNVESGGYGISAW